MDNKKFYWIKLRTDFFNRNDIDFLLSQENGCQYVVLYQMLCLNTANSNGRLETKMNEVIIPYDVKKIARDTKYFDTDTIIVALELYKKLGLIYEEGDNILKISNLESMVGSESASREAIKKRQQRLKLKLGTKEGTNCPIENRDKRLDIRDKSIDKDIYIDNYYKYNDFVEKNWQTLTPFEYETLKSYCSSRGEDIVILAIQEAIKNKKKTLKYVEGILKNWKNNNLNTLEEIEENDIKKEKEKKWWEEDE